jgi:hypothetical protein
MVPRPPVVTIQEHPSLQRSFGWDPGAPDDLIAGIHPEPHAIDGGIIVS